MRACRELGIVSVAVYSEADRAALHVRYADEAYPIGPPPARESYLRMEEILAAAKKSGAEAIHPGYGFLSENPGFAVACAAAGIKFIGPTAAAMQKLGSKTSARLAARQAAVPVVPGSLEAVTREQAAKVAAEVGYPVMLKAAACGGVKAMLLVRHAKEVESSYEPCCSEAKNALRYVERF